MRHAKIICTMGPACSSAETIRQMLQAGMNCARMNFSHGTHDQHRKMVRRIRKVAHDLDRSVAILQDLQGPKIRTGPLKDGKPVFLEKGKKICLTPHPIVGTAQKVTVVYKTLLKDVTKGSRVLIDDGRLELVVSKVEKDQAVCRVVVGGELGERKGVNLPGVTVSIPFMTKKDWADLKFGLELNVNFVALSFVREAKDIIRVRRYLGKKYEHIKIIAKIERAEALENLDEILEASDGVMVARGDLGVEIDLARVAIAQKEIINSANDKRRFVITATHMLDSMVANPRATRAEVSDVSNAIYDGTDAVMLSGETATGRYPVRAVRTMTRIIAEVEHDIYSDMSRLRMRRRDQKLETISALVAATCHAANLMRCPCLGVFTTSGRTAWHVAKGRPFSRIIAFTSEKGTFESLSLAWGVHPIMIPRVRDASRLYAVGVDHLKKKRLARRGDTVLMIAGTTTVRGSTNTIRFQKVR